MDAGWESKVFFDVDYPLCMRKLVALSRLPGIAAPADGVRSMFAANLLRVTGRCEDGVSERPSIDGAALRSVMG